MYSGVMGRMSCMLGLLLACSATVQSSSNRQALLMHPCGR